MKKSFGTLPSGEETFLYTISCGKLSAAVTDYGATLVSLLVPDRDGVLADVVLGYKHPEGYFFDGAASGKSVGRCANRIAFGQMTVERFGACDLDRADAHASRREHFAYAAHGAPALAEEQIEGPRRGAGGDDDGLPPFETRLRNSARGFAHEDRHEPFEELNVEAVFDFDDDNALEITYLARTDKTTVVNLTNHVYFNLAGEGSGSVLDHELRLNSSKVLEMNDKQIPTGRLLDAAGTPQDFREFRPFRPGIDSEFNHIRDFKGYDHPFVIDGWQPNILGEVGTLREPRSGRSVTVLSSQPSVMIYTGNWLAGGCPETKSGGRYNDYDGVAIECQNYPDAVNHPDFPSPLLRPGELYCQKIVFRFGTF